MKKILILSVLSFLTLLVGCSKDEPITVSRYLNLQVNGKEYEVINENIGGNENCQMMYIHSYVKTNEKTLFKINFKIGTRGNLVMVRFIDFDPPSQSSHSSEIYLTPNYNPVSTFEITNFVFKEENNYVYFDFDGTVFYEHNNDQKIDLSGNIELKDFQSIACEVPQIGCYYLSDDLMLISHDYTFSEYEDNTQQHIFFTNSGYTLIIDLDQDLWESPIGTLNFDVESTQIRISLKKYIGETKATLSIDYNSDDWITYETRGSFTIEEKYVDNESNKIISGIISMDVLENEMVLHSIDAMSFKTKGLEF